MRVYRDLFKLFLGLFLFALGIVLGYLANIGYAPWEVFYVGVSIQTGLTLGQATIFMGILILLFVTFMGEPFGLGTIANMVFVGVFIDLILDYKLVPLPHHLAVSLLYVFLSMVTISIAIFFYVSSAFGAGPPESLLILGSRKTGLQIGSVRRILELILTFVGWLLGGRVGIGTMIFALCTGPMMNLIFPRLGFHPQQIQHRYLYQRR